MFRSSQSAFALLLFASLIASHASASNACFDKFTPAHPAEARRQIEPRNVNIKELGRLTPDQSKIRANARLTAMELFQVIENHYGPLELKKLNIGLKWETLKRDTLIEFGNVRDTNELYNSVARLMFKLKDAHVSVEFPSTLTWTMPLQFRNVNRQLLTNFIDGSFPAGTRKPELGDALVEINGQKPGAFQDSFEYFSAGGSPNTDKTIFGYSFARWREQRGMPLSTLKLDKLSLRLWSRSKREFYTIDIPITKQGRGLIGSGINGNKNDPAPVQLKLADAKVTSLLPANSSLIVQKFNNLMLAEARAADKDAKTAVADGSIGKKIELGGRDPSFKLPENFKPIEFPKEAREIKELQSIIDMEFFVAGTYVRDGKTVGFLRVPSYSPQSITAILPALRYYIAELNAKSDYLVIDQMNNPGGYVTFGDWVVKSLVGNYNPSNHMQFAVKPSQKFLREYADMIDILRANQDNILTKEEAESFAQRLEVDYAKIERAKREDQVLSEPVSLLPLSEFVELISNRMMSTEGTLQNKALSAVALAMAGPNAARLEAIFKNHQVYDPKKKVYFLINELCFSGGDAVPAMLQDYKRVEVVGVGSDRTAGAGGTVEQIELRGQIEAKIHLTTSLMVRKGGRTVEGSGVHSRGFNVSVKNEDVVDGGASQFNRIADAIATRNRTTQN